MNAEILVEVTRGEVVERVHAGHLVVIDKKGDILFSKGDPYAFNYMRSCAKPVQVLPLVINGGIEAFGFTKKELAIMCASHYAEEDHIRTVQGVLAKIGLSETDLRCGAATSLSPDYALTLASRNVVLDQLYNDCSGKHSGMLALCLHRGYPIENYLTSAHPLQREILNVLADFCEVPEENITLGIDGCSAPVFALPLYNMALAYLKLSNPEHMEERAKRLYKPACEKIFSAMTTHPEMVAGTGGFCTELMAATNGKLIGKVGADGVYCVGVKGMGLAMAVKVMDGSMSVLSSVVVEMLSRFGVLTDEEKDALRHRWYTPVLNDKKIVVGEQRPHI